eukprot:3472633-Pleurochrysis_carterae.AAC.1
MRIVLQPHPESADMGAKGGNAATGSIGGQGGGLGGSGHAGAAGDRGLGGGCGAGDGGQSATTGLVPTHALPFQNRHVRVESVGQRASLELESIKAVKPSGKSRRVDATHERAVRFE